MCYKTHSMNHAGDRHQTKMGVFSRRFSLKLNSSGATMLVTTDDRVVQRIYIWLWTQPKNKNCHKHSTLTRPSAVRPRDTVLSSEEVWSNCASHNWLALTTQTSLYMRMRDCQGYEVKRLGGQDKRRAGLSFAMVTVGCVDYEEYSGRFLP